MCVYIHFFFLLSVASNNHLNSTNDVIKLSKLLSKCSCLLNASEVRFSNPDLKYFNFPIFLSHFSSFTERNQNDFNLDKYDDGISSDDENGGDGNNNNDESMHGWAVGFQV